MKDYWQYPYEVKTIQLPNSQSIAYIDEGKGEQTIVMIHGLGSYLPAWQKMIAELSADYRCIAIDLPGYGQSTGGDYAYDMDFFANSVQEFITTMQLENVVLAGHSMGAQIAMTLALKQENTIDQLVLLAPAGFETFTEAHRQWFAQLVTPAVLQATTDEQIEQNFAINFFGNAIPEDARFMYEDRLKLKANTPDYEAYCNMIPKCVQGMLMQPVFDKLEQISLPTLILFGENDNLIPNKFLNPDQTTESIAKAGHQKIPESQMKLLPECGHFILWDQAKLVSNEIKQFTK